MARNEYNRAFREVYGDDGGDEIRKNLGDSAHNEVFKRLERRCPPLSYERIAEDSFDDPNSEIRHSLN